MNTIVDNEWMLCYAQIMTTQYRYRLKEILDAHEEKSGKRLPILQISNDTGISRTALNRMMDRTSKKADLRTLHTLIKYLREKTGKKITLDTLLVDE